MSLESRVARLERRCPVEFTPPPPPPLAWRAVGACTTIDALGSCRGVRRRPRAAPVVRCLGLPHDCRRDMRQFVAIVGRAAAVKCGRCSPVSGRAGRWPWRVLWARCGHAL
jgi:hypothetical protein